MVAHIDVIRDNLIHNIQTLCNHVCKDTERKIIAVVKAQAYGVGLKEVVETLENEVDAWAVDDIDELYSLRFLTEKDVYLLGYTARAEVEKLIMLNGIPLIYDTQMLLELEKSAEFLETTVDVNIKIDALLGRQGVHINELNDILALTQTLPHVNLRGVYGHFANLEDTQDTLYAQEQREYYQQALEMVAQAGYTDIETHMSATAGALIGIDTYTHVRLGIGLFGGWPSQALQAQFQSKVDLKPVVRWVTHIAQIKNIAKGMSIGYGRSYIAQDDMTVAVIPQGYSDGYNRLLSNQGEVLIHGVRCPVVGRVAMNMFVVDVTHVGDVMVEDEVVLLGKQGENEITTFEIAQKCQTINYEVLTWLNPLLPRRVV